MSLPCFELTMDDWDSGVAKISLVDNPAIGHLWVALNATPGIRRVAFSESGDEQVLYGPVMVPDQLILRRNEQTGEEFNIFYKPDTIRKMRDRFFFEGRNLSINVMHDKDTVGNGVVESWLIKDPAHDKAVALGMGDLPAGTWMIGVKIPDTAFWKDQIKTGKLRGFSLEGEFAARATALSKVPLNPSNNMNPTPTLAERLAAISKPGGPGKAVKLTKQVRLLREKGALHSLHVRFDDQGHAAYINPDAPDAQTEAVPDGEYIDANNTPVIIDQGVATGEPAPVALEEQAKTEAETPKLAAAEYVLADNGGTLVWDPESKSGILRKADGTEVVVTSGSFATQDGKMITIVDGVMTESAAMSAAKPGEDQTALMRQAFNNMSLQLSRVQIQLKKQDAAHAAALAQRDDVIVKIATQLHALTNSQTQAAATPTAAAHDLRNPQVRVGGTQRFGATVTRATKQSLNSIISTLKSEKNGVNK